MTADQFASWLQTPAAHRRALIQGVLNVTPDSFSDGGRFLDPFMAAEHAARLGDAGADLIDVGGESTRPGSVPVSAEEQIGRVVPVIHAIVNHLKSRDGQSIAVSIDTTNAQVAAAAIDAGASIVNDISAGRDDPGDVVDRYPASRSNHPDAYAGNAGDHAT